MSKNKSTKRALLLSALSLLLCVSMLVGSTFAWFTDSVTSGNNIIKAGNLDVELDYKKVVDGVATEWASVKDKTDIFDPNALWEPGHVEVVYLRVANKGSLELKYQLGVNFKDTAIGKTEDGKEIKLSDHLVFATVASDTEKIYANRDEVVKAAAGTEKGLKDYNGKTTALEVGGVDYLTLIVYMPETVGNEANYRGDAIPTIELGINLYATQYTAEEDSFDEFYDEDAWADGMKVYNADDLQAAINNGETEVIVMDNIEAAEAIVIPKGKTVALNLNGKAISAASGNAIQNNGVLTVVNGTLETEDDYAILNNGTLTVDAVIDGGINNYGTLTVEGGKVFNMTSNTEHVHAIRQRGTLVVNGGAFYGNGNELIYQNAEGTSTVINGGTFDKVEKASYLIRNLGGSLVVNGGTFYAFDENTDPAWQQVFGATIYGGTFNYNVTNKGVAAGYKVLPFNGNYIVLPENVDAADTTTLIEKIKNAPVGETTEIVLADGTYAGNIDITLAAMGQQGGDVVIKAADGANPVITGKVTLGLYEKGTSNVAKWNASVTFEGITFDQAADGQHSISVQNLNNITLKKCTIIGDGEYGIGSQSQCPVGESLITECKFVNASIQGYGKFSTDLVIDKCTFEDSHINIGAGDGVTVQNCKFDYTVTDANVGDSFYIVRTSSTGTPITVKDCEINIDSTVTGVAPAQAKWAIFHNRHSSKAWTIENVKITMTDAALAQPELVVIKTAGGAMNVTNVTLNGAVVVNNNDLLNTVVANGATKVMLADGEYDLNGIQKDGLTLIGVGNGAKVANTTKYASGKAIGAIWKAINLENVTITNTVYTMADGGKATFNKVNFAAGFRQGYGTGVVFTDCTFGSNSEGYALHFQTDATDASGKIQLNGCKFEGGKVHLGGKRVYEFTGCDFAAGTDFQVWSDVALDGCTVNGEKVTTENMATLFPKLDATKVTIK